MGNLLAYSSTDISSVIDYSLLKPVLSVDDVSSFCSVASKKYKNVCVNGSLVPMIKSGYPKLVVSSVVDFPLGAAGIKSKVVELASVIASGADEADIVLSLSDINDKRFKSLENSIRALLQTAHSVVVNIENTTNRKPLVVKFIIETGYFDSQTIKDVSKLIRDSFFSYLHEFSSVSGCIIKTCTGLGPRGVSYKDIEDIKEGVGDSSIGIKAAGGIDTYDKALMYYSLGVSRIGSSIDLLDTNKGKIL